MAFGDKLRGLTRKAKDLANDHPDQADQAINKVGDAVGQKTGGKYDDQIHSAESKAGEFLGIDHDDPQPAAPNPPHQNQNPPGGDKQ